MIKYNGDFVFGMYVGYLENIPSTRYVSKRGGTENEEYKKRSYNKRLFVAFVSFHVPR